jgi:glycine cleavage system H protein
MTVPTNLKYARSHEWARVDDGTTVVGITEYAQDQLGEVVYVEVPDVGTGVDAGEELGTIESVKAVAEFLAPVAGEVIEVNERLADEPNLINEDPYGDGWLVKLSGSTENPELLDAAGYEGLLKEEST